MNMQIISSERAENMIPLIDLTKQYETIETEIEQAIKKVLRSGNYILGPEVQALESEVADYCGVKHAVAVGNGTDALVIALDALGIGQGDEVITTPFTFFATAEAISRVGARPVFTDIDPDGLLIDPDSIENAITPRTKAILPVHIFGQMADMERINDIAAKYGLAVVEDACQAIGSSLHGKKAGSWGHAACFSFFPTKNLGTYGDGGMIVTNDPDLAAQARLLRVHGSPKKYIHSMLGYNSRLDEIHAAILRIKLKRLDSWNDKRRQIASSYNARFSLPGLVIPSELPGRIHIYHLYVLLVERRDHLKQKLTASDVGFGVYYPLPLHLQAVYEALGYRRGDFPISENACERALAIPAYPEMTDDQVKKVMSAVLGGMNDV